MNNESNELDYAKERLDTPGRLSITVRGRSYYYYPARKRWRAPRVIGGPNNLLVTASNKQLHPIGGIAKGGLYVILRRG
jgi:hypothetical protein